MVKGVEGGREEIVNGLAPELVAACANIAAGFVKNDDHFLFGEDAFAIDADVVGGGDAGCEFEAGGAVDLDAPGFDQLLTTTAGTNGARCQVFVETDSLGHKTSCVPRTGRGKMRAGYAMGINPRAWSSADRPVMSLSSNRHALS